MWAIPAFAVLVLVGLGFVIRPDGGGGTAGTETVEFARIAPVIGERCAACHALSPTQPGFSSPPAGLVLETPSQIKTRANDIRRVVSTNVMPLGNITGMTDEERALVIAWITQGASTGK